MSKKKIVVTLAIALLGLATITTNSQALDTDMNTKIQLQSKGIIRVHEVKTKDDTITEIDHNGKPQDRVAKKTMIVKLVYTSSKEANANYGAAVREIFQKQKSYKKQHQAEYLKINIYRNDELVAYLVTNEKGERTMKILDDKHITSLGMGMSLMPEEQERQLQLVERVDAANE